VAEVRSATAGSSVHGELAHEFHSAVTLCQWLGPAGPRSHTPIVSQYLLLASSSVSNMQLGFRAPIAAPVGISW
jgi:hypothetical protein